MKLIKCDYKPNKKIINYDNIVANITDKLFAKKSFKFEFIDISNYSPKILILNSEIYDAGGHTECALRYIKTFNNDYPIYFYLTNVFCRNSDIGAPVKSQIIKENVKEYYESSADKRIDERIIELYKYILANKITTINVNIHENDVTACAILYLIKKYTNINIIFWNHADHFYSLGTNFADKILTRCKNGKPITPYLYKQNNALFLPFLIPEYKKEINDNLREELNIPNNAIITLTGCGIHKLGTRYFELIKQILDNNKNIYHVWVGNADEKIKTKLYKKYKLDSNRFIIKNITPDFNSYITMCDFYVDSFPQGSALTLIDCIQMKKPVVIKINKQNKFKSFEEYLYKNYELAASDEKEMLSMILKLAEDKTFYNQMQEKVYNHFQNTYSAKTTKSLYEELIK